MAEGGLKKREKVVVNQSIIQANATVLYVVPFARFFSFIFYCSSREEEAEEIEEGRE